MYKLEEELLEEKQLVRKGITHEQRLSYMGLNKIIELIGMGYPLITRPSAKDIGVLNIIKVPEHKFYAWLLKQSNEEQDNFNNVCMMQKNRRKEDLIEIAKETSEEFDRLIKSYKNSQDYEHEGEAQMLDRKSKSCLNLLKQLIDIEKSEKGMLQSERQLGSDVHIHVHTDEERIARLKKLRSSKD